MSKSFQDKYGESRNKIERLQNTIVCLCLGLFLCFVILFYAVYIANSRPKWEDKNYMIIRWEKKYYKLKEVNKVKKIYEEKQDGS